ncbi:MAG TPA: LON peptidase substrate-binding domain-containing protein, partial [Nitrospiraceae bacterium]|nr:LON peptidase substrate-binding domain-containing protein [Nitrospiraceae bacterium]
MEPTEVSMDNSLIMNLPVLPVKRTVLFPGVLMPLTVGRDRSVAAVEAALKTEDKTLLVVAQRDPHTEEPGLDDLHTIGTKAVIKQTARGAEGQLNVLIQGLERFVLLKLEQTMPYLIARARHLPAPEDTGTEVEALHRAILDVVGDLPKLIQTPGIHEAMVALGAENDPVTLAYRIASLLNLTLDGEQQLLEASSRADLLRRLYAALSREVQILQLRDKIASDAREKIGKSQREYILREQLKAIQEELGESNGEESEIESLKTKIAEAELPEHVRKEAERELGRLAKLSPNAPDHQVIRSYLELVLELPWNKTSADSLQLSRVREVLDE